MLVFNLQILALQAPVFTEVDESKYVQFSEELPPQFSVTEKENTFEYFAPQLLKVAFFQKVRCVFQISKSPKKYVPKNYPELEI